MPKLVFEISNKEYENFKAFEEKVYKIKDKNTYSGASGGRFTFLFTRTSLGTAVSVKDNLTHIEKNITDFETW